MPEELKQALESLLAVVDDPYRTATQRLHLIGDALRRRLMAISQAEKLSNNADRPARDTASEHLAILREIHADPALIALAERVQQEPKE